MQSTEQILASTPQLQLPTSSQTPQEFLLLNLTPHLELFLYKDSVKMVTLLQQSDQLQKLSTYVGNSHQTFSKCRNSWQNTAMRLAQQLGSSVIVLTARSGVEALVNLLDEGADDVLRKPFGLEELAARCRTLLKRGRID